MYNHNNMAVITPFDPWKNELCSCPDKYSLSAYTGCGHGCLYCYASSYIRSFFKPRPKKDFINRLRKEIRKFHPGEHIAMANSSDPYLPLEKQLRLTRSALEIIENCNLKLTMVTKSSLILRDIDILEKLKNIVVSFTITTLDKDLSTRLEPYASTPQERLKTMRILAKKIPVVCRLDPLIYPLNIKNIRKIVKVLKEAGVRQVITSTYKVKPDNLKRMVTVFSEYGQLWQKLYLGEGERKGSYIYLPYRLRKELIILVRKETLKQNMEFSSCREGMADLNTAVCDGSSFF